MNAQFRPPAVPLITHDPYFSCWSMVDCLYDDWPRHWTGMPYSLFGIIRVDGTAMKFMGGASTLKKTAVQSSLEVTPLSSTYIFDCGSVELTVKFTSPLLPDDLDILSRPASYILFTVTSRDNEPHQVELYYDISAEWTVADIQQEVVCESLQHSDLAILTARSVEQNILEKSGDTLCIDWGTLYCAAAKRSAETMIYDAATLREGFADSGRLVSPERYIQPRPANSFGGPALAVVFTCDARPGKPGSFHVTVAYDDEYSIEYFGKKLRPWWRRDDRQTAVDMLSAAEQEYADITRRCGEFDKHLIDESEKAGGENYAQLLSLVYRQAVAAHKLVAGPDGTPLFFSKENNSNGCIATVDVTYPSSPLFLLLNSILLKGMLIPICEYCKSDAWEFPFAAHDLGTYPKANGQVYGDMKLEYQMPVEESANMIILAAALACAEQSTEFAGQYWELLTQWAEYLKEYGMDPADQLCTDDFAGRLAHNTNLSIKAIIALACYGKLAKMIGDNEVGLEYILLAKQHAEKWQEMAADDGHTRLTFDKPGTWSMKYNLAWDGILGLNLFPQDFVRNELAWYRNVQNEFGVPLDSRRDFTKPDWIMWCAALADDDETFRALADPVYTYAHRTPSRVPLSDWYDTKTGIRMGTKARSVVGGFFMKMLKGKMEKLRRERIKTDNDRNHE
jgi:hypothetical protein